MVECSGYELVLGSDCHRLYGWVVTVVGVEKAAECVVPPVVQSSDWEYILLLFPLPPLPMKDVGLNGPSGIAPR